MDIVRENSRPAKISECQLRFSTSSYEDLITHIYQGFLESPPWQTFLRLLCTKTGSDVATLMLRPGKSGHPSLTLWECDELLPPEAVAAARADQMKYGHLNPLVSAPVGSESVFTLDQVISQAELVQSEFYEKLMAPYRLQHMISLRFRDTHGASCFLGLINGFEKNNFTDFDRQLLLSLRPHLEHAIKAYARFTSQQSEKAIYRETLNRLTLGTIILDGRGKILEMNLAAKTILQRSQCIGTHADAVVVAKPRFRDEFNRLVEAANAWHEKQLPDTFAEALRIECHTGNDVGLLVRAAPWSGWSQKQGVPSVIIHLEDFAPDQCAPERIVARLFGLTQSEARLAALLANGVRLTDAALKLNVTESSVRTYAKKIFGKMGVSRQAELVRVIMKSVALLARPLPVAEH